MQHDTPLPWPAFLTLVILFCIGIGLRILASEFNQSIFRRDIRLYSTAAESLVKRGDLLISHNTTDPYFYSTREKGGVFLEHNPLWTFLAAPLVLTGLSGIDAVHTLSFGMSICWLVLLYFFCHRLAGQRLALFVLVSSLFSYILIDYSGNGSFYTFQGVLYILFLLAIREPLGRTQAACLGVIMGCGLLLNQQTLALVFAYGAYMMITYWGQYKKVLPYVGITLGALLVVELPWLVRNYMLFQSPFFSVDMFYVWGKIGVLRTVEDSIVQFHVTPASYIALAKRELSFWLPHNMYFINRKLFILAPLTYCCALFLAVECLFAEGRKRAKVLLPLFLVLVGHLAISAIWPIPKFRYFVPILPFFFILGGYYILHYIKNVRVQNGLMALSIACILLLSGLTYLSTPTHTYYNDGPITSDPYGANGELEMILARPADLGPDPLFYNTL